MLPNRTALDELVEAKLIAHLASSEVVTDPLSHCEMVGAWKSCHRVRSAAA
jgi:hypothetical protein